MSTALAYGQPICARSKTFAQSNLNQSEIDEVVNQIVALRRVEKVSGFSTRNSIVELMSRLTPADLVAVGVKLKANAEEVRKMALTGAKK